MNSDTIYTTVSTSSAATLKLGEQIGRLLKGGEIIELISDLGGGKTVLVKGIAAGLGYTGDVTSPTFTVSRVYKMPGGLELHHFDFYRLGAGDIVARELAEVLGDPNVIVAIEWAANAGNILPENRLRVDVKETGSEERVIIVESLGETYSHIIQKLWELPRDPGH